METPTNPIVITRPGPAETRTEFGFTRTVCACAGCARHCRQVPGYLIPADVPRISRALGCASPFVFALKYLLASPGATVARGGTLYQIPTLVPRRQANGACVFLDDNNRCRIHAVAPYGCSFFDAHQAPAEADERSQRGLSEIARHWANLPPSLYVLLWHWLARTGRQALPPHLARAYFTGDNPPLTPEKAAGKQGPSDSL